MPEFAARVFKLSTLTAEDQMVEFLEGDETKKLENEMMLNLDSLHPNVGGKSPK